jgi:Mg-chelatase subunit ChlD
MRPGLVVPGRLPSPGRLVIPAAASSRRARRLGWRWSWPERLASFEQPTVPLPVGERGDEPVLVVLVIDESPSEQALDPQGYRHVAARRLVELLRAELRCREDRVACVHFSTQPRPWLGPTNPHTRTGRQALRQMLRSVGGGGGTDIRAALELGASLIPKGWPGSVVVVLLSDGQDGSSADQLTATVERLPPGSVHVISIAADLPATWTGVPLGSTTVIPSLARPDEVEWATARALYRALGLGWAGPVQPPASPY